MIVVGTTAADGPVDGRHGRRYGPILGQGRTGTVAGATSGGVMVRSVPLLAGCPPEAADVLVRDRVLALRAAGRSGGERLAAVRLPDVVDGLRPVPDRAWWEPDAADPRQDRGLRTDVASVMLGEAGPGPLLVVWTRGGPNEVLEQDLAWTEAIAQAAGRLDVPVPPLVVVTRWGWWCHPTGGHHTWKRLRERGPVVHPTGPRH